MKKQNNVGTVTVHSSALGEWPATIGKLLINCGNFEMDTYVWLELLTPDEKAYVSAIRRPLSERIDLLDSLLKKSQLPEETVKELRNALLDIRSVIEVRNTIAHNPISLTWIRRQPDGPPDFIGAFNAGTLQKKKRFRGFRLQDVKKAVDMVTFALRVFHAAQEDHFPGWSLKLPHKWSPQL